MPPRSTQFIEVNLQRVGLDRGGRAVLRDIDWRIRPGERWVLLGGNGAGKTQLLKLVAGAVWPTPTGNESRRYLWRGETWSEPYEVKEEIAYLGSERQDKYERYGWNHRVQQVVGTGLYRTDIPLDSLTEADGQRIQAILKKFAIAHLAGRRFLTLSYGERRLTLLACALATRPKLLLLDELANGLDDAHRVRVQRWLERTATTDLPWVLATHRMEDVPRAATHMLVLDGGRVVYKGVCPHPNPPPWNEGGEKNAPTPSPAKRGRVGVGASTLRKHRTLVRLSHASVYLNSTVILRDISLELKAGECWAMHGPNGSGKTTLLRAIYGDHAVAGGIKRAGIEPGVPLEHFKRRVGWVAPSLQADHPQYLTVAEVVQSGRYASIGLNEAPTATDRAAARGALASFGLTHFAKRPLRELSYGQLRRVLFARAWVRQPQLLLLDEPFAGVDALTRAALLERIEEALLRGVTVMMALHHLADWPRGVTHELSLRDGRVVRCGPYRGNSLNSNRPRSYQR